ncbi:MAG: PIN domain-containing protein [Thermoanaerobaculia bacterium]
MRILIDTDVLLDLALDRAPHAEAASRVLERVENGAVSAVVAWHTISNLYYLLASFADRKKALNFIRDLIGIVEVAPTGTAALRTALNLGMNDFEDAMQVAAALAAGVDVIVTRNVGDFRKAPLRAIRPADLVFPERE